MKKNSYIGLALALFLIAFVSRCPSLLSHQSPLILVEGSLYLGQTEDEARSELTRLGYEFQLGDELIYSKPSVEDDPEKNVFIRLEVQYGRLSALSGRPAKLVFDGRSLVIASDIADIKGVLGTPDWEKPVGNGAVGLCYENYDLYLTSVEGKLNGFSLGDVPKERP